MKLPALGYLPCALAAAGFLVCGGVLWTEVADCRRAAEAWAERDLAARTQLAVESIADALDEADFAKLRAFTEAHRADGLRLTVLSSPGGMLYDSDRSAMGNHSACPEVREARETGEGASIRTSYTTGRRMLYCARRAGDDFIVRLAIPYERVVAPLERTRLAMLFAGLAGASGLLLVLLFMNRLIARNRALARERDVQAHLAAELRRVADFRRDFIANVSHEIKTPLTGILGAVELLGDAGEADRGELLGLLRREATRLDALARDVVSLARLERGGEEGMCASFAPTDLADVLASAADRVRPRAEAAGMRLEVAPAPSLVLSCDARLVEQALVNLALNAVAHSGSPDVALALAPTPDGGAAFTVTDHGVGLAEADRARIFERFYRVDKAHSRETGGSGLGLAIVKHIARIHGGDATVVSAPGEGCVFTFTLRPQTRTDDHTQNDTHNTDAQHAEKGKQT